MVKSIANSYRIYIPTEEAVNLEEQEPRILGNYLYLSDEHENMNSVVYCSNHSKKTLNCSEIEFLPVYKCMYHFIHNTGNQHHPSRGQHKPIFCVTKATKA